MYESMLAIYHASELDDEYHVRGAWEGFIAKGKQDYSRLSHGVMTTEANIS